MTMLKLFKPTKTEKENYSEIDKLMKKITDNNEFQNQDDLLMRWVAAVSLIIILSTFIILYLTK